MKRKSTEDIQIAKQHNQKTAHLQRDINEKA